MNIQTPLKLFSKLMLLLILCLSGCSKQPHPLQTVAAVDLARYMGTWYEIASYPNRFQQGCRCTRAQYHQLKNHQFKITNQCLRGTPESWSIARGKAWLPDERAPGKLKVQFFWPFYGRYWIIAIDPQYRTAIVASPDRKMLWFLARTQHVTAQTWARLNSIAAQHHFSLKSLKKTRQTHCLAYKQAVS